MSIYWLQYWLWAGSPELQFVQVQICAVSLSLDSLRYLRISSLVLLRLSFFVETSSQKPKVLKNRPAKEVADLSGSSGKWAYLALSTSLILLGKLPLYAYVIHVWDFAKKTMSEEDMSYMFQAQVSSVKMSLQTYFPSWSSKSLFWQNNLA